jgi:hypothetical protein
LPAWYEAYFHLAGMERMILDVRGVNLGTSATSWLAGPRKMRSVMAVFAPHSPNSSMSLVSIPAVYDMIIYFDNTSAAVGLPFQYPTEWE